jgi:hypothetical protein
MLARAVHFQFLFLIGYCSYLQYISLVKCYKQYQPFRTITRFNRGNLISKSCLLCHSGKETSAPKTHDKSLDSLIQQTESFQKEASELIGNSSDSKELEVFRVLFLGKNGKITSMMKEMKVLSQAEKPKLGEVVNRVKSYVEEIIESRKEFLTKNELLNRIQAETLGNTFEVSSIPGFFRGPGKRHPIPLVLDMTTEIFEEIGYEVITGPESSPEIENDFFNFEALGMPPSVSSQYEVAVMVTIFFNLLFSACW